MDIAALQLTLRRFAEELLQLADRTAIILHTGPGAKTHVLVDWENVQPNAAECRALVPEATDVWLFHGPNQKTRRRRLRDDFHLSFYMGYIASKHPEARFVVLSNDKGYGPMLDHAKQLGFVASQIGFGAKARATRKAAAKKVPAKQTSAKKKAAAAPAARKASAKKSPVPKPAARKTPAATLAKTTTPVKTPTTPKKSFEQVLAILNKSPAASRPRKYAGLLSYIGSRVGGETEGDAQVILDRLVAEGKVTVDDKRNVSYQLLDPPVAAAHAAAPENTLPTLPRT